MPDDPPWGEDITASPVPHARPPLVPPPASLGGPPPTRPGSQHQPPVHPDDGTGWSWRSTAVTLGVLLVIGLGAFWYLTRDTPVAIEVDGRPIANAETILARGEAAFDQLVKADGARPADDAGCWFAPARKDALSQGPQLACGPVLLGVSGTRKPWVLGTVTYGTSANGEEATGTFASLDGVADPDTGDFARPDGRPVPSTADLAPAKAGIRAEDGRRLVNAQATIDAADQAFAQSAQDAGAAVTDDSACFFGGTRNRAGQFLSEGEIWCGPVLLLGSAEGDTWSRWTYSFGPSDSFALAEASPPPITSLTTTMALEPGLDLARPDGREVPAADGLEPPDAEPIEEDAVEVVDDLPGDLDLSAPDDGRLIVPSQALRITGLARVPKVGSGAEALVAAPDHELIVVEFELEAIEGGPPDRGTAQLMVDGSKTPLTEWSSLADTGNLVISVPAGADDVAIEVLFDGVAQRISLLTGQRAKGFPAALYRDNARVGIGQELKTRVALPVGDPASTGGVVSEARVVAWIDEVGWAPKGKAFLVVTTEGWQSDSPCCDLSSVTVTPLFSVRPEGSPPVAGLASDSSSQPDPVFVVPAGFTKGRIGLAIRVAFERDGVAGAVEGGGAALDFEIPA